MMIAAVLVPKAQLMNGSGSTQSALSSFEHASAPAAHASRAAGEMEGESPAPVLFYDGVCGLCNRFVDFVIARDAAAVFRFAPLQGETAREHLPEADVRDLNTVVLQDEQGVFRKSAAAVRVLMRLGGGWGILGRILWLVPRPLRDAGYLLVARYRYAIFGKKETCRMPTPAERARFLP
jgi:predicted DCC family thiol-disulfide oxidoreductase YuxK